MLFVPEGDFSLVAPLPGKRNQTPQRQAFHLSAFCIDRTEVPMSKWDSVKCGVPDRDCISDASRRGPAVCIAEEQAECYCEKASSGWNARLPTDAEWLYAALGSDGRKYPWGNDPYPAGLQGRAPDFCSFEARVPGSQTCAVDASTRDKGPFGVIGMGTNGFEMNGTCVTLEAAPKDGPYCLSRGMNHEGEVPPLAEQSLLHPSAASEPLSTNAVISFRCATAERGRP
ncbi:MAG: SUMF1/EgtB/PvdO family nonheme iron enzyme [Polyangiaceae bacterium]